MTSPWVLSPGGGEVAGTQGRNLREEGLCWERGPKLGKRWSDLATTSGQEKEMTSPFTTGIQDFSHCEHW